MTGYCKKNPCYKLKIPDGIHCAARELRLHNDLIFYYELKCLNVSGGFPKAKIIQYIQGRYSYSQSAIYKKLSRLLKLGWIRSHVKHYSLCKYEVVFQSLGLSELKIRSGDVFKTIYHPRHNPQPCSVKELILLVEIRSNLYKQEKKIKSLDRDSHTKKQNINPVATLSCEGVARLLGYKTSTQGWHIEQQLLRCGLITIKNRTLFRGPRRCFKGVPKKCFVVRNNVIQQLANDISIV